MEAVRTLTARTTGEDGAGAGAGERADGARELKVLEKKEAARGGPTCKWRRKILWRM